MTERNRNHSILDSLRNALGRGVDGAPDADLLHRFVQQGDHSAFELLVWRHMDTVLRVCRAVLRNHHSSEDAAQAVFFILARKAATLKNKMALVGWLHQTSYRVALRAAARLGRTTPLSSEELAAIGSRGVSDDLLERHDLGVALHEEIARMPEKYRLPILFCYFQGMTHADAAKRLDLPVGTLASRVLKAKEILQESLERRGIAMPAAGLAAIVSAASPSTAMSGAAKSAFVATTVRGMANFSSRDLVPGTSAVARELAHSSLRAMAVAKVSTGLGLAAVCTVVLFCGIALSGREQQAIPTEAVALKSNPVEKTSKVRAPIPAPKVIDPREVERFKDAGFSYGRFIESPNGGYTFAHAGDSTRGLPGFSLSPMKFVEVPSLHMVNVPFGVQIHVARFRNKAQSCQGLVAELLAQKNLVHLAISGLELTDEELQLLASSESLKSLQLQRYPLNDRLVGALTKMKKLESLVVDQEQITAKVFTKFLEAGMVHKLPIAHEQGRPRPNSIDTVHVLNLERTGVDEEIVNRLSEFKDLRVLHLNDGHRLVPLADSLMTLKNLESVTVRSHMVDDETLRVLVETKLLTKCSVANSLSTIRCKELDDVKMLSLEHSRLSETGVAKLAECKNLETLDLTGAVVNDAMLKAVVELPSLRRLRLRQCQLTTSAIEILASSSLKTLEIDEQNFGREAVSRLAALHRLDLLPGVQKAEQGKISGLTIDMMSLSTELIEELARLGSVKTARITLPRFRRGPRATLEGMKESLQQLSQLNSLESLTVMGPLADDAFAAKLGALSHLKILDLSGTALTENGVRSLAKLQSLEVLKLDRVAVGSGVGELAALPNLHAISLEGCNDVPFDAVKKLAKAPALSIISGELFWSGISIQAAVQAGILHLAPGAHASGERPKNDLKIESLVLRAKELTAGDMEAVAKLTRLKTLTVASPEVREDIFAPLTSLPELETLDVTNTAVGEDIYKIFAGSKSLRLIQLPAQRFTDRGLKRMFQDRTICLTPLVTTKTGVRPTSIEEIIQIDLSGTAAGDETLKAAARLHGVEVLILANTCITEIGTATLGMFPNLRVLNLSGCRGLGETALRSLSETKRLETLILDGTHLTEESLRSVVDAQPPLQLLSVVGVTGIRGETVQQLFPKCNIVTVPPASSGGD